MVIMLGTKLNWKCNDKVVNLLTSNFNRLKRYCLNFGYERLQAVLFRANRISRGDFIR